MLVLPHSLSFLDKFLIVCLLATCSAAKAQTYCYASGPADCSGSTWLIETVRFAGEKGSVINHSSSCEGYADNTLKVVNVIAGGVYQPTVHTASLASNLAIFVDWNNDGNFDSTETYLGVSTGSDLISPISAPSGLTQGPRRMRVRATSYIDVPAACGMQNYGEVEDYTVYYYTSIDSVPESTTGGPGSYCAASGPPNCSGAYQIDLVKFTGEKGSVINHSSACDAYADNTSQVVNVIAGGVYQPTVHTVSTVTNRAVFIDWNNDGSFDATETYFGVTTGSDVISPISPPSGLTSGPKRMRIRSCTYLAVPAACGVQTFGEVEDYTIYYYTSIDSVPETTGGSGTYCYGAGPTNCAQLDGSGISYPITNVAITGDNGTAINNTSGCDQYADFTNKSVTLTVGNPYTLAVTGGNGLGVTGTWIDWNEDFDFDDPGEMYMEQNYNITSDPLLTVITPPADVLPGKKRMRIRNTGIPPATPCGVQYIGEVEDYSVIVFSPLNPAPECVTTYSPANNAPNQCQSVKLSWNAVSTAVKYKLRVFEGATNTKIIDTSLVPNTFNLTGLAVSTDYKWLVIPVNSSDVSAVACDTLKFTTSASIDPVVDIQPSGDTIQVCKDATTPLLAMVTGGSTPFTYTWASTIPGYLSATNIAAPNYSSNTSGFYKLLVQVQSSNQCFTIDSTVVSVLSRPVINSFTASALALCPGGDIVLRVNATEGIRSFFKAPDQVTFNPFVPVDLGGDSFKYSNIQFSEDFVLAVTDTNGCQDSSSAVSVNVYPTPANPIVSANKTIFCPGDSALLSVDNYTDNITWNKPPGANSPTILVKDSGDYIATYTSNDGCMASSALKHMDLYAQPDKPLVKLLEAAACQGLPAHLYVDFVSGISWDWNDDLSSTTDTILVNDDGVFQVTATNINGCVSTSDNFSVNFHPVPAIPQINTGGLPCPGGEVLVYVTNTSGDSYQWNDGATINDTITTTGNGAFSVKATNSFGCMSYSDTVEVVYFPAPPVPTISFSGDSCAGGAVVLHSSLSGGNRWSNGPTTDSITVQNDGMYKLVYVDANGCSSSQVGCYITFEATPVTPVIVQQSDSLKPNPLLTGYLYRWYFSNGVLAGETNGAFLPPFTEAYRVVAVSPGGCSADTSGFYNYVGSGISTFSGAAEIKIYPQPATGWMNLELPASDEKYELFIFDLNGRLLQKDQLTGGRHQVKLTLASGAYVLKLTQPKQSFATLLMIE